MTAADAPFVLRIPSDLRLLGLARTFVQTICQALNFDTCFSEALQLATHEALQNIIRHAHLTRPDAILEIQLVPIESGLEVRLLDEGSPFDVAAVPHFDPGEMRFGGRGVFLMRRLVDEMYSAPRQPSGNMLRMIKLNRPAPHRHLA